LLLIGVFLSPFFLCRKERKSWRVELAPSSFLSHSFLSTVKPRKSRKGVACNRLDLARSSFFLFSLLLHFNNNKLVLLSLPLLFSTTLPTLSPTPVRLVGWTVASRQIKPLFFSFFLLSRFSLGGGNPIPPFPRYPLLNLSVRVRICEIALRGMTLFSPSLPSLRNLRGRKLIFPPSFPFLFRFDLASRSGVEFATSILLLPLSPPPLSEKQHVMVDVIHLNCVLFFFFGVCF